MWNNLSYSLLFMQTHILNLDNDPFQRIATGKKLLECRLYDEKRKLIQIGDIITFTNRVNTDEQISVKVIWLLLYPTFNQLFKDTHQQFFPQYTREELEDSMLAYYSKEDEEKYGVVGIRIEKRD